MNASWFSKLRVPARIWRLGADRFRVQAPSGEQMVEGYPEAQKRAHELAAL
jgi:hypothetical protein